MEKIEIHEIKKLVDELSIQLKQGGQQKNAEGLLAITERFKQPSEVRPAVYALDQAVRRWLQNPGAGQDPATHLTAQFLVDACKNALSQGAIRSLPPTPRESARKLGRVAGLTLAVGLVLVLVPVVLLVAGVNWVEMVMPSDIAGTEAVRGQETGVAVGLSSTAPKYDRAIGVRIGPVGNCDGPGWDELSCEQGERLWADGVRHPTFHIVRNAEVNGIMIAVRGEMVRGGHGAGELLVYVDKDAASGEYLIPLEGAYVAAVQCDGAEETSDAGASDEGAAGSREPCDPNAEPTILAHSAISPVLIRVP